MSTQLAVFKHDGNHKKVLLSYYCIHYTKMSILISNLPIKQSQIFTKLTGTIS